MEINIQNRKIVIFCGFPSHLFPHISSHFKAKDYEVLSYMYAADAIKYLREETANILCIYGNRYEVEWLHFLTRIATDPTVKKIKTIVVCNKSDEELFHSYNNIYDYLILTLPITEDALIRCLIETNERKKENNTIRILCVDDSIAILKIMMLQKLNIDADLCSSGEEALQLLYRYKYTNEPIPYNMILVDHIMTGMMGEEFILTIKRDPYLFMIPVIIISSSNSADIIANCMNAGACEYIIKPITLSLLRIRIHKVLSDSELYLHLYNKMKSQIQKKYINIKSEPLNYSIAQDNSSSQLKKVYSRGNNKKLIEELCSYNIIPHSLLYINKPITAEIDSSLSMILHRQNINIHTMKGQRLYTMILQTLQFPCPLRHSLFNNYKQYTHLVMTNSSTTYNDVSPANITTSHTMFTYSPNGILSIPIANPSKSAIFSSIQSTSPPNHSSYFPLLCENSSLIHSETFLDYYSSYLKRKTLQNRLFLCISIYNQNTVSFWNLFFMFYTYLWEKPDLIQRIRKDFDINVDFLEGFYLDASVEHYSIQNNHSFNNKINNHGDSSHSYIYSILPTSSTSLYISKTPAVLSEEEVNKRFLLVYIRCIILLLFAYCNGTQWNQILQREWKKSNCSLILSLFTYSSLPESAPFSPLSISQYIKRYFELYQNCIRYTFLPTLYTNSISSSSFKSTLKKATYIYPLHNQINNNIILNTNNISINNNMSSSSIDNNMSPSSINNNISPSSINNTMSPSSSLLSSEYIYLFPQSVLYLSSSFLYSSQNSFISSLYSYVPHLSIYTSIPLFQIALPYCHIHNQIKQYLNSTIIHRVLCRINRFLGITEQNSLHQHMCSILKKLYSIPDQSECDISFGQDKEASLDRNRKNWLTFDGYFLLHLFLADKMTSFSFPFWFNILDYDEDGYISISDISDLMRDSEHPVNQVFTELKDMTKFLGLVNPLRGYSQMDIKRANAGPFLFDTLISAVDFEQMFDKNIHLK
ncbi:hypothetical protein WA158_004516 [Blastocystis sp. Blastoise]